MWLNATKKEREELGNPFLQMFASCASEDVKAPEGFAKADFERKEKLENAQDTSNELEIEASLEAKDAYDEKLTAEAKEQTEANEEFAINQQEDETKYGPDDRHSDD